MIWTSQPRLAISDSLSAWSRGSGQAFVLLHGVGLNADAWIGQLDPLAEHCKLIAIDLPGHGQSPRLVAATSLGDYSEFIAGAIAKLPAPVLLAGHSMGAMIALDIAIRHPEKLLGVVAMNAVFERSEAASRAVRSRAAALTDDHDPDPTPTLKRWFGEALQQPEARACRHWLESVNPKGYQQAYQVFAENPGPAAQDLRELNLPALFMTGADDANSTPAMSRAMAKLVPRGQAVVMPGAAHMMPMTHAQLVNQQLLSFLNLAMEIAENAGY